MRNNMQIMGIMNITPDSFYDGRKNISINDNAEKIKEIINADIIDVGCESSRPGRKAISFQTEIHRLNNFIPLIANFPDKTFSIDTCKYEVALHAVNNGFKIVNDITSGMNDVRIFDLVAENDIQIILMHMQGKPETMQNNPQYDSIIDNIISFFENRIEIAKKHGIRKKNIIIDPGVGFGKTKTDNDKIIRNVGKLKKIGSKVLLGVSRKSFLEYNDDAPKDRLPATLGVTALLADKGVDIIRVHDVNETISMLNSVERIVI